jgi:NleD-like pathogen effector protein (putative zinc metallopeptidase)
MGVVIPEPKPVPNMGTLAWAADLQKKVDEALRERAAAAAKRGPLGISMGAWDQAMHQVEIKKLLDRIATGRSQLTFAPTSMPAFRDRRMEDLKELAQTPAGFKLLSDLDASPFKTTLVRGTADSNGAQLAMPNSYLKPDGTPGPGFGATVRINPVVTTYADPGQKEEPWMTERQKYGFYHELVHAWHSVNGTSAPGDHQGVYNTEWQATGFGPYASAVVSDNIIRQQMGKGERPHYSGVVFNPAAP